MTVQPEALLAAAGTKTVSLGETATFVNGYPFKPADWSAEGLPIIRIQNLTGTSKSFNRTQRDVKKELLVENGDLLVSWSGTLDVFRWAGSQAVLNQHIFKVKPNEGVDPDYLYFALRSAIKTLAAKTHGSTMKHVVRSDFESARILMPSLDLQRRISAMLSCAESIIQLRGEAEATTARVLPATFVRMFGDPLRNSMQWPVMALGDVLSRIDSGKSPRCQDRPRQGDEWGVLRLSALRNARYDESDHKALPAAEVTDTRHEVRRGDLLLSRKNTLELVGTPAYVWETGGRILLPDLIFRLCIAEGVPVNPIYLWALLSSQTMRKQLSALASGTAASMLNISKERLRGLRVMVPELSLQEAFAEKAASLRALAQQQQKSFDRAQKTLESLSSRCFRSRELQRLQPS